MYKRYASFLSHVIQTGRTDCPKGPGFATGWTVQGSNPDGAIFSTSFQTGPWGPEVKRPGRGADHSPPSKRRGHERVELYLYSPSGPSWPVIGRAFTFTILLTVLPLYSEQKRKQDFFIGFHVSLASGYQPIKVTCSTDMSLRRTVFVLTSP